MMGKRSLEGMHLQIICWQDIDNCQLICLVKRIIKLYFILRKMW